MWPVTENAPFRLGALEFAREHGAARWVVDSIHGFAADVGSIIPHGFERYVRVFHPARLGTTPVTWTEIAAANGTVMHAEAQLEAISGVANVEGGGQPGIWDREPDVGRLPPTLVAPLVEILVRHTTSAHRCWFCVWEGWGGMWQPRGSHPRVELPQRRYVLITAPISAVPAGFESLGAYGLSLWWPDDRAWCVATEIDFRWTYVGGSAACIDDLVQSSELEALPTELGPGVTITSDPINPLPGPLDDGPSP